MFIDQTEISNKNNKTIKYQKIETETNDFTQKIINITSHKKSSNNNNQKPNLKIIDN